MRCFAHTRFIINDLNSNDKKNRANFEKIKVQNIVQCTQSTVAVAAPAAAGQQ